MRKIKPYLINASAIILVSFTATATADHAKHTSSVNAHHQQVVADDKQLIRDTINTIYDTPEHKVLIDPIVVQGDHAIASWTQQNKGGRALLYRNSTGVWARVLCSGKAVKEAKFLMETGIPQADADMLAKGIEAAEANLDKEKIALFDSFKGVVRNNQPAHHHGHDHGKDHSHHESSGNHAHH